MHLGTKFATKKHRGGRADRKLSVTLSEFKNSSHFVTALCPHVNIPRFSEGAEEPLGTRLAKISELSDTGSVSERH